MKDYQTVLRGDIDNLTSCCEKCTARFNSQSSLSSYNTTADIQYRTVDMFNGKINIERQRLQNIQRVIGRYEGQLDNMYPRSRLSVPTRRHCQTEEMEREFKRAHSPVRRASERLEEQKRTRADIEEIDVQIQRMGLNPSNRKDRRNQEDRLEIIKRNIAAVEEEQTNRQAIYVEKALKISKQSLPSNHRDLAGSYNNIGLVYFNLDDYPKALSYYEKTLEIQKQSLPSNHPDLGASYNNIGVVYSNMGDYPKALSFYKRAVENGQHSLPANHPDLQKWKRNLVNVKKKM